MYEIPAHIKQAIDRYEPVEISGLTLYPVRVKEQNELSAAAPSITFMQQTLPVDLMRVPLLTAYYRLAMQAVAQQADGFDLFYRAVLFLTLSLRIGEGRSIKDRVMRLVPIIDKNNPSNLKCLRFTVNGEEIQEITPTQFQRIRPILAAQNGIELVSEDANPELVEAERDILTGSGPQLRVETADEISFVAALDHTEEREIYEWPVLKLKRREKTFSHILDYLICGIAEAQGTKWKEGNPHPHPFYDKIKTTSPALKKLEDVAANGAAKAVQNPGQKTF